jgi:hypothetical protein
MNTVNAQAGWHPDPSNLPGTLRWWDGSRWTEHTHPAPVVQQPAPVVAAAAPVAFPAYDQTASAPGATQFSASTGLSTPGSQQSLIAQNSTTFTAIAVAIGYVLLAATTGIVLLGIVPAMLAFRAFSRGEKLAPLGVLAAAGAILYSLSALTSH